MKKILYLGNKFFRYKKVKSVLETLEPLLGEICEVKSASDKKNKAHRFLDMLFYFFKYGIRADKIIIDVYSTQAFYFALVFGSLSAFLNKRFVLFLHGGNLPSRYERNPRIVTFLFSRAEHIVAPSNYLTEFFESKGFELSLIPNIVAIEDYKFKKRRKVRPAILALRGFGKPYNPLMTLKSISILKDHVSDVRLLMLGNKDEHHYKEVVEFVRENSLEDYVDIKPKITRLEWLKLSEGYDIMVSNPVIDNTPVSLIEGMALGMCVVSTKVGGIPHMFSDNECALIRSNDHVELSMSILRIVADPGYARALSINGNKKASDFTWESVRKYWEIILNS
jgi:glycosyltransferase involved in cell wall biosynthesis